MALSERQKLLQRQEGFEVSVGVLKLHTMVPRAGGDQDVNGGSRLASFPAALSQNTRRLPDVVSDRQPRKRLLEVAQDASVRLVPGAVPELEPDGRAPCGLTTHQQTSHALGDDGVASSAEAMHPAG